MTREELTEMIKTEIRSLAFETLRTSSKKVEHKLSKPKTISEEDAELFIFHGGNKPNKENGRKMTTSIKESYNGGLPKINKSEIIQFEDSFEEMLKEIDGASVVFDMQRNGESMIIGIGQEGIEAGASGTVEMGNKGKIEWSYSLKNGLTISTKDLIIDKGNKLVLDKIYNNYYSWQKDWREKLTIKPSQQGEFSQETEEPQNQEQAPPVQ